MKVLLMVLVAAALGAAVGELTRRHLLTLGHLRDDERARPEPGRRLWVPTASGAALALLAVALVPERWPVLIILAPLALAGPWLAAVDLHLQRLPDKIILPLVGWLLINELILAIVTRDLALVARCAGGGLVALVGFGLLYTLSWGALGLGDVRLGALLGFAATMISWTTLWWALMTGSLTALLWALIKKRRSTQFAFGPWLLLGALAGIVGGRRALEVFDLTGVEINQPQPWAAPAIRFGCSHRIDVRRVGVRSGSAAALCRVPSAAASGGPRLVVVLTVVL
jgi:leader peptidase (prepilin peptidase)/N-methyltransferase